MRNHKYKVLFNRLSLKKSVHIALLSLLLLLLPSVRVTAVVTSSANTSASRQDPLMLKYKAWSSVSSADLITKAKEFFLDEHPDSALICYSIVANRYSTDSDLETKKICAQAFNNAGYLYFFHYQDYAKSYAYLIQAMEISEELKLTDNLPYVYLNLGNMYLVYAEMYHPANPYKRSIDLFKKGMRTAIECKDWDVYLTQFINLCNIEIANGTVNTLRTELTVFDKLTIPQNVPKLRFARLLRQAITCLHHHDYAKARSLFFEQIKVNDSPLTPERFEYQALYNIVCTYKTEHNYAEAIRYTLRVDSLAKAKNMRDVESEACEELASLYNKIGDKSLAGKYRYIYLDKKDSIMTVGKMEEIGEIHFLHELQKVEDQIHDLNTKRRIEQTIMWGIAIVSLIVIAFLIIINRKNKALRERNLQLYHNTLGLLKQEENRRKELEREQQMMVSVNSMPPTDSGTDSTTKVTAEKYQASGLSEDEKDKIVSEIEKVLTLGNEIYSPQFSLDNLAELVNSKAKYVSQVINERYEKNFNTLIGDQRIKEACKRMLDQDHYGKLTLEGIAQSVGFKSRNTFSVAFKRVTGLTPSEYQKLSKQQDSLSD